MDKKFYKNLINKNIQIPQSTPITQKNIQKIMKIKNNLLQLTEQAKNKDDFDKIKTKLNKLKSIPLDHPINKINIEPNQQNTIKKQIKNMRTLSYNNQFINDVNQLDILELSSNPQNPNRNQFNNFNISSSKFKKMFQFSPTKTNGTPIIQLIIELYQKYFKEETKQALITNESDPMLPLIRKFEKYVPIRDIRRTPEKFQKFLKIPTNKILKESSHILNPIKKYADIGLVSYGQWWDYSYPIAYILANGNINNANYIFDQCYPFYTLMLDFNFWNNINFINFFVFENRIKNSTEAQQVLLSNIPNPLSMSILTDNLIQKYQTNHPKINYNDIINKCKIIFTFSNYTYGPVIQKLETGLYFLAMSIYLPTIAFYNDFIEGKIIIKSSSIFKGERPLKLKHLARNKYNLRLMMFEHLMNMPNEELLFKYNQIISKYKDNYIRFINESNITKSKDADNLIKSIFLSPIKLETKINPFTPNTKNPNITLTNFTPLINNEPSLNKIKKLYENCIVGEPIQLIYEQMKIDYNRNIELIKRLHQYIQQNKNNNWINIKGNTSNISIQSLNKFFKIMLNHIENGLTTFGQDWFLSVIIAFTINLDKPKTMYYYFNEIYPYYSFLTSHVFYTTINPLQYIRNKYTEKFTQNNKLALTIPNSPFAVKILNGQFIDKELTKEELEIICTIFHYSNYLNKEVKYFIEKFGLIFLLFAYCLPDLYYIDEYLKNRISNEDYNYGNLKNINKNDFRFQEASSKVIIYKFFMKKNKDTILSNYKRIIQEYFPDYIKYVKETEIYNQENYDYSIKMKKENMELSSSNEEKLLNEVKTLIGNTSNFHPITRRLNSNNLNISNVNQEIKNILLSPITY